ncbi:fused MFS/spermidine synthase [Flavobacterium sp. MXW15]|uniref:Fused MFS/spermidine synthase n=1 Tax=Xanthomonas chitinilytica TaxID=2989819 RepID=A0ABT3JYD4_9XANT|nr:fused MFS/spermidine synthase [Xanthomonas sp. H13-6]MCW4455450.1 fused MFS/spermidine synthase [Flavobacterium sp. MXW15]MCW4473469.1 fused MFS/spermidine synthase [Xanthomonas sp. H13-6]
MSGPAYVRRTWRYLELQFRGEVTQTRMLRWSPDRLHVGYTRTMLSALWLHPAPRSIGIIGLGGGAQAKFCHRHLPQARIEAVESDAGVLALRDRFRIPADSERLQVVHGDGARWLRDHRGRYDLLLVDAYDVQGIPPALSTREFYDDCRAALTADGVMAGNLYATDARQHFARLRRSFDGRALRLDEPGMSNQVVIAWNGDPQPGTVAAGLAALPWRARGQLRSGFERLAAAWGRNASR